MNIIMIPGLMGHPQETVFKDLKEQLINLGHKVYILAWPNFPDRLTEYNFTNTINSASQEIERIGTSDLVIMGVSMGGIIATYLARKYSPQKLVLAVSPDQAGTEDDLANKYKNWMESGYRELKSSIHGLLSIPFSFIEDAKKYNALNYIPKVNCPILFIVGEKDEKIKLSVSTTLFEAANEPKYWDLVPNMQHRYQYQEGMLPIVNKKIIDFIEEK